MRPSVLIVALAALLLLAPSATLAKKIPNKKKPIKAKCVAIPGVTSGFKSADICKTFGFGEQASLIQVSADTLRMTSVAIQSDKARPGDSWVMDRPPYVLTHLPRPCPFSALREVPQA